MKKTILLTTTILLSLLTFIAPAKAETKVTLKQTSNGNINTKLHYIYLSKLKLFKTAIELSFSSNDSISTVSLLLSVE